MSLMPTVTMHCAYDCTVTIVAGPWRRCAVTGAARLRRQMSRLRQSGRRAGPAARQNRACVTLLSSSGPALRRRRTVVRAARRECRRVSDTSQRIGAGQFSIQMMTKLRRTHSRPRSERCPRPGHPDRQTPECPSSLAPNAKNYTHLK